VIYKKMDPLRGMSGSSQMIPPHEKGAADRKSVSIEKRVSKSPRLKKALFVSSGIIALILAYVGIIVPGFPAIPFIILAAYFFAKSSPRIYAWLIRQRIINRLLIKSKKVDRRVFKGLLISQVWFSVGVAEVTLAHSATGYVLFACGGIVLTALILIFMKVRKVENTTIDSMSGN
jgi:uncharacterized protein